MTRDGQSFMAGASTTFNILFPVLAVLLFCVCVGLSYWASAGEAPIEKYHYAQTVQAQIDAGETPMLPKRQREAGAVPTAEYYATRTAELEATVQAMEAE